MLSCSVGICVYNEEKNIQKLLDSLFAQKLRNIRIGEIVVIASGTTDQTCHIVRQIQKRNTRIRLLKQPKRQGKASAVNLFIKRAHNEILVLVGGDLLLTQTTIQNLVSKFEDTEVGMTGARPIPINNITDGFCGFAAHFLWDLHHKISLKSPKMGEAIAFRKIFRRIPVLSSVDEANIEPLIRGQGYKIQYVPKALIYNKAPTTISDFIKQRRRIYNGHLAVKNEQSYEVATLGISTIFSAVFSFLEENPKPMYIFQTPLVILLEAYSRFLGWWDYKITKKRHTIWEVVETTKKL